MIKRVLFKINRKYRYLVTKYLLAIIFMWILVLNFYALNIQSINENISYPKIPIRNNIQPKKFDVNCEKLIKNDQIEIEHAKILINLTRDLNKIPDQNYVFDEDFCDYFKEARGYNAHTITDSEYELPIAYSILTYFDVEQFERLLRTLYRPHNLYCIHVDAKSPFVFYQAVKSITQCFANVFIASRLEQIVYAGYSRLQADINCMNDLLTSNFTYEYKNKSYKWKYLINLASTEFPLRSNYELTQVLRVYNGSNDIEVIHEYPKSRVEFKWIVVRKENSLTLERTKFKKSSVPFNFTIVKGITYCVFSRDFIHFVLNDQHAQELLEWSKDTYSPDEWYWATLNHNIQFNPPGGYKDLTRPFIPSKSRYIRWFKNSSNCNGLIRNNICILTIHDLKSLKSRSEFFANKFFLKSDPIAYQCMEDLIDRRAKSQEVIKLSNYCKLPFVNHQQCLK